MYVQYGNYRHAVGEVELNIVSADVRYSDCGVAISMHKRYMLKGQLHADDEVAMAIATLNLEQAYAYDGRDLVLYHDDGSPTAHQLLTSNSWGGTRVTQHPVYPDGKGYQAGTYRDYVITVEAEYPSDNAGLVSFQETLSLMGGGPQYGYLEVLNGPPQAQLLKRMTTYRATQQGRAIGAVYRPDPPSPLWSEPIWQPNMTQIRKGPPERWGPPGQGQFRNYPIEWSYAFASASPLYGVPTGFL